MDKGRIMQLNEMKPNRTIKNPHWTNDKKNQIHCEFHYENGPIVNACVSDTKDGNPDWKEIFDTLVNVHLKFRYIDYKQKSVRSYYAQAISIT